MSAKLTINCIDESLLPIAQRLTEAIAAKGGRTFVVGGAVRDALMGKTAKDLDMEVYGLEVAELEKAIAKVAPFDAVGRSFGVFKLKYHPIDIALPRRESKVGSGHKGFEVVGDPNMSYEEACARRDFTINSILWDIKTGEVIDPFKGQADLKAKIIRHTSLHFAEDPLRVLRAMQFAARFEFTVAPETVELCRHIQPENLPPERLFEEWKKLIIKGNKPSLGLNFLRDCAWVQYYPELAALIDCPQDPEWHPEGDVWAHTLFCMDGFAQDRAGWEKEFLRTGPAEGAPNGALEWENLVVGLAVLTHDFGKPSTTQFIDGHYRARGHDVVGVRVAEKFLKRLTAQTHIFEQVLPLVECHMRPRELYETHAGDNAIRRLARKVGRIDRLVRVVRADMQGRPPMSAECPEGDWLLEQARRLEIEAQVPTPLILGRHLIELGYSPSIAFKGVLEACYEAQLEGEFKTVEDGKKFLQKYLERNPIK